MPVDQFASFITILPEIEALLQESGETVPRPNYSCVSRPSHESDLDQGNDHADEVASKKNIDATSDEDEEEE